MGASSGRDGASLAEELYRRPTRFQFFQAVRLLRRIHSDRAGVGRDNDPDSEFVRFRSDLSYAFPVGDVGRIDRAESESDEDLDELLPAPRQPDRMLVNFLGVATPASFGSLPTPYVEEIRHQERTRNFAMREFLDVFNHRLISHFYRAWERTRPDVLYESGEQSPFEQALRAVIGIEGEAQRARLPFDDRQILARAGLIAMRPAPASALEGLVKSLFGVSTTIEPFLPTWYEIEESDRTRLGETNSSLGLDTSLGAEVCLNQWRFRLRLGPMGLETYEALLPEGDAFQLLCSVIRMATGAEYDAEYTLVLQKEAVPTLRLGDSVPTDAAGPCRLGWTTWLGGRKRDRDADDAVFTPSLEREEARDSLETRA